MVNSATVVLLFGLYLSLTACAAPAPTTFPPPASVPGGPVVASPTPTTTVPPLPVPVTPTPTTTLPPLPLPATPGKQLPPIIGVADVERIEIVMRESLPVQVSVIARGELPDGCTKIGEITQTREGNTITVRIATTRPQDAMCTMATVPFELPIAINAVGLPKGKYIVQVNDIRGEFTLEVDNVASSMPTPAVRPTRIAWAEMEALVLSGEAVSVFQTHALEVTVRMKDGRTLVSTEPRIDLIFEVVRRCGAKCAELRLATE